ncbi:hypothetical protein [Streptomyces sp. NPDC057681]|uniref:hypothetical protein n=1 Tax=unclassified Streptomyces TaxID=2593676 RepID=UPI00369FEB42
MNEATIDILGHVLLQSQWPPLTGAFDLLGDEEPDVPSHPGVYVLVLNEGRLPYPRLESSVIYVGESRSLNIRLRTHRRTSQESRNTPHAPAHFACHAWIAARGGTCMYSPAPHATADTKAMRARLLQTFERRHHMVPVANCLWGSRIRPGLIISSDG